MCTLPLYTLSLKMCPPLPKIQKREGEDYKIYLSVYLSIYLFSVSRCDDILGIIGSYKDSYSSFLLGSLDQWLKGRHWLNWQPGVVLTLGLLSVICTKRGVS